MADFQDMLLYAATNIAHRKLRSYLTVLGIVIGVGAIIALIAIAQGLTDSINSQLSQLGSRYVAIMPGDISQQGSFSGDPTRPPTTGKLFENDRRRIEKVPGVDFVSSAITARADARYKGDAVSLSIIGVEPDIFKQTQVIELESGRFLTGTDRRTAVIGFNIANKSYFTQAAQVGSVIRLGADGEQYRVVGVLKKGAFSNVDGAFYVPLEDARKLAGGALAENEVSAIRLTVKEGYDYNDTVEQINNELLASHGVKEDDKDFTIVTSDFIVKQVGQITGLLTLFLGGIAGISLIVGGVGVANTMFMSVIERTREIGTLKAVGASRRDILNMFLIESGLIGLGGGTIGTVLGVLAALAVKAVGEYAGFSLAVKVSPELVAFGILFSFGIGMASGYIPALRGANLSAIDALREE